MADKEREAFLPERGEVPPAYFQHVQEQGYVIKQQPQLRVVGAVHPIQKLGPSNLVLPWVATCVVFLICAWCSLPCTVTAIIMSCYAHVAAKRGDIDTAKKSEKLSVGLTIIGLVIALFFYVLYNILSLGDDDEDDDDDDDDDGSREGQHYDHDHSHHHHDD